MAGGEVDPLGQMLTAFNPRSRRREVISVPSSLEEGERTWDGLANMIAQTKPPHRSTDLAGMDMTIYSVKPETRAPFMWSRWDGVASAVTRGELGVEEFTSFLELMGKKVTWPKK
jgi:hypothetical protein